MKKVLISIVSLLILAACSKKDTGISTGGTTPEGKIAPDGFIYQTTKQITVDVTLQTNVGEAIPHIPVALYALSNNDTTSRIAIAVTDASGNIHYTVSVPASTDTFVVRPNCIGILNNAKVFLVNNTISCTLGGAVGFTGNVAGAFHKATNSIDMPSHSTIGNFGINGVTTNTAFNYLGSWSSNGLPNYLTKPNDTIATAFLNTLIYTLPEAQNLSTGNHASLLNNKYSTDIILTQKADVWITFLYENCGYSSSMGYYVYATNNPPKSVADIKNITFIYPNCKFNGNGGGLVAGNKVKIGTWGADTTIGLVLYANAWNGSGINTNAPAYFTDSYLNPELASSGKQQHTVLLQYTDPTTNKTVYPICFEDLNRVNGGSDNDFNDVCVYASTNPVTAIDASHIAPVATSVDTDGDGVCDPLDAYPNDPTRAYNNYYPSASQYGTVAFEDNWPLQGDYDMNDLVISYQYNLVTNAKNQVVEIYGNFAPIAAGATYQNAFGVQLPFTSATVSSVTGQRLGNGYIKQNSNGTEAGQTNAVIIPFDGTKQMISNIDGNSFINTLASEPKVKGDTSHVYVKLTSPLSSIDPSTFNPFCISNMRRGYEIHLPGSAPTSLANTALFGTGNDASVPSEGFYYVTKNNYPFAINFAQPFAYPTETTPIYSAYLHFLDWSGSAGSTFTDWYSNTASGYQNTNKIYNK